MPIEEGLFGILLLGMTLYILLGGADFGAGIWEFNTALRSTSREKALVYEAIGPVWEANHVWLIFILVGLSGGFPVAFEALFRALWIPLLLVLVGIVFRGMGFAFRSYAADQFKQQKFWEAVFALASTATPFFLGAMAGAVASGKLGVTSSGEFHGSVLTGWIHPLSLFSALFTVGICAYLSSVYLVREAHLRQEPSLVSLWRRRSIATGLVMGLFAVAGLILVRFEVPDLWEGFRTRAWPLIGLSGLAGVFSLTALIRKWYVLSVLGAAVTVGAVLFGWGVAQYPVIIPPEITVESAKAPRAVVKTMVIVIAGGSVLLAPAQLFKGKSQAPF